MYTYNIPSSAITLFEGIRRVCMLKKLSAHKPTCRNIELVHYFNPGADHLVGDGNRVESLRYLAEREWHKIAAASMCALEDCLLIACEIQRISLPSPLASSSGDVWHLTEDALQLILQFKTDDAIGQAVGRRLRHAQEERWESGM